ncbi:hypothetical protein [Labrenzia sp. R5_0]|uniref:hypothetical protein n=1 Tax=Labrenzia sp. R5_0 TaxID=2821108 RepID=UPI001ADAE920|nr:hypothetical protein [Labrenzia sp. R5_0]MBO9462446.1 hypothetical protein [Labrenzia sp. R5_0]
MSKKPFERAAAKDAAWRREGLPDPAALNERGIRTKESLDWLEARHPKPPSPELDIDNPALHDEAIQVARQAHQDQINALRRDFHERPQKARQDFGTARDYQKKDRER